MQKKSKFFQLSAECHRCHTKAIPCSKSGREWLCEKCFCPWEGVDSHSSNTLAYRQPGPHGDLPIKGLRVDVKQRIA